MTDNEQVLANLEKTENMKMRSQKQLLKFLHDSPEQLKKGARNFAIFEFLNSELF